MQNVAIKWVTFLLRFRESPGAHLGPDTASPDIDMCRNFSLTAKKMPGLSIKVGHYQFFLHPIEFIIANHIIQRYTLRI
jgi:hypothetical protein